MRICAVQDATAVVVRHGDDDAGALFVKVVLDRTTVRLYGPDFAGSFDADAIHRLVPVFDTIDVAERDADDHIASQARFDPDLWLIEVDVCPRPDALHDWLTNPGL